MRKYVLDLSAIYSDHRRKAYLGHRPTWTTIRSLIQTVREVFGISSHVHVCSAEQIFYPDSESVEMLRDGETLKVLLESVPKHETKIITDWEEDFAKAEESNNPLDSTIEDIDQFEQILIGLPKPKRRRVRKRKVKKIARDDPTEFEAAMEESNRDEPEKDENFSNSEGKGKLGARKLSSSESDERPCRNLNRQIKARVVRAASLLTLTTPTSDEVLMSPPSELNGSVANEGGSTRTFKKARVVRALSLENTVEVKRELIEAGSNGNPTWPLEIARQITTQMGLGKNGDMITTDEHEVSLTNDLETYSTIVSDV